MHSGSSQFRQSPLHCTPEGLPYGVHFSAHQAQCAFPGLAGRFPQAVHMPSALSFSRLAFWLAACLSVHSWHITRPGRAGRFPQAMHIPSAFCRSLRALTARLTSYIYVPSFPWPDLSRRARPYSASLSMHARHLTCPGAAGRFLHTGQIPAAFMRP